jgi:cellulose synthase/poly-beta-1,6-N-acetylglucosamine synthase-like glycosyltransferase
VTAASAILFGTSAIFLLLALHPFVIYPLALRIMAYLRPAPLLLSVPYGAPRVAVCVCAYNEERVIGDRIRNILAFRPRFADLEILIYVDGAADRTADIVRGFGDAITAVISDQRLGKTHGMNTLVSMTQADIVVFSDANVTFAPGAIANLVAPFADPTVGCVCGHLRYLAGDGHTAETGSLYWRLEEYIKAMESATGSVMGADGSIFAIRRTLHRPPPPHLIDDMYVSLAIVCAGARVVRAENATAYEASVATARDELRARRSMCTGRCGPNCAASIGSTGSSMFRTNCCGGSAYSRSPLLASCSRRDWQRPRWQGFCRHSRYWRPSRPLSSQPPGAVRPAGCGKFCWR